MNKPGNEDSSRALPNADALRLTFDVLRQDHPSLALSVRNSLSALEKEQRRNDKPMSRAPALSSPTIHGIVTALSDLSTKSQEKNPRIDLITLRRLLLMWMEFELRQEPVRRH